MTHLIQLDSIEKARRLRQLIDGTETTSIGSTESEVVAGDSSIVVRLLTAISAGSTTTVKAEIMTLNGNTWQGTGQTVDVRSATGLAVTTTGRRIARKCSRWGYVVVET